MPLSSLTDPVDLARAHAAFKTAWDEIKSTVPEASAEQERLRLAYIVAAMSPRAEDENELTRRSIERYHRAIRAEGRSYG